MICIDKNGIEKLDKVPRLNLINSCMGYKSANLIGSISQKGIQNLAIFSSITHLGSNPALLGFILRPTTVPRHTYSNIKSSSYFSVNAITKSLIKRSHQTSANYNEDVDEFQATGIQVEFKSGIQVPFVKESPIQLLCKYQNEYLIKENGTIHLVASIEKLFVKEQLLQNDYWIQLDLGEIVAINGLDGYASTDLINRFAYARVGKELESIKKAT
jgi:flavin reductase (DIM6/NTAB) family NADH-FMN oxidoreductase RutF